ncbi:MAG: energy-coupling factor transporter transmembrane protein EcfT [Gammaproteobacteria bacterium]|nr:energy-coupling factor transporter transmembrane protein EcfT [Gammaproteobacteria bacterium]
MHPVIRIVSFLILAGFVAFGGLYELAAGFVLVLSVVLYRRLQSFELSTRIIKRMRWLFLSILIVYLWFTPGEPILPFASAFIPTFQGLQSGMLRVFSLILIIFAVNYFIATIARNSLVEAIVWLLYPLHWFGIETGQLALRIALTLELIPRTQQLVLDIKQHYVDARINSNQPKRAAVRKSLVLSRLVMISHLLEMLFERTIYEADRMPPEKIVVDTMQKPPLSQWVVPVMIAGAFWGIQYLAV